MSKISKVIEATNDSFETDVLNSDIPVLVDFWAQWCGPCKAIAPSLDALADDFEGKVKIVKVNIEDSEEIASKYAVRNIPALFIFKNGEIVDKVFGAMPKSNLATFIEKNV